ncbi:hypothetical protein D0Z07_9315 [Hyphodiscus hymeniophilus]|uniref:PD-(D/E)XK nuclease-like domain-containing protein n=1 Tax=Hyphodiscus hymeniophilus TaxID=353542 RepID=A0A9P6SJX4_9HELO|nr:hypothetical protein D0Z07_9315 [Hyphodiscus hymeniophilus]
MIPHSLKTRLRAADPDQSDAFKHLYEDPTLLRSDTETDALWRMADKIYVQARSCYNNHRDESEWVAVVKNVLESVERAEENPMLCIQSIQTQSIDPTVLPFHASMSLAKKADLALSFSIEHPTVLESVEPIYTANPSINLSQMTDAYTSTVPLVCGLEVKERGGDYNEAITQLAIWSAAGLERLRELRERVRTPEDQEDLPPFLGWTVIGHDWKLHISWKNAQGEVVSPLHDPDVYYSALAEPCGRS